MQDIIEGFQLSPQQKRLWLLQQNSLAYRAQLAILIDGNLKVEVLKEALQELVNQHEILHTTFHSLAGMKFPIQVIENPSSLQWQEYDLSSFDIEKQEASIEELFREQGQRPFNLQQDPLLRLTILTLSTHRHILLISLPSLCADISTLSHLVQEISRFYARSKQTELDEAPVQYVQFSAWQNELLEAEDAETGTDYWRKQDISHLLDLKLPFETQPTESLEFKPQFIALTIQPHTLRKIEALVQEHEISTSVFLLACWQILLRRLTLQSDIVVGSACDGRSYEELEGAIGLFTKYLPVHCHLEDNFPFSQVLRQVDESAHEASSGYEYFAWEQTLGRTENIDFMLSSLFCFDFEQQKAKFFADDVSFSIYKQYACVDRFKVKLSCIDRGDGLLAEFHYDSNLFYDKDIERLAEQFYTLLESVVSNPKASISELEILSNVERRQLLVEFNETGRDYSQDKCIHHLIEEQVERTPNNIAVIFQEQQLTYQELNARANQLAHYLQTLGVGSDTQVGICVERSLSMIVGILGILKAGGAYVPINPAYPNERLAYMLEDSHVPVLLTQQPLVESLPEHRSQVICLDGDWDVIAQQSNDNPVSRVMADNLAYIIYTSGSTGQPKGVQITHQNLVHSTLARILYYYKPVTNFLLTSPFAFDSSVAGIFWTLCQGGTLSLPQENFQSEMLQFIQLIAQRRISHLLCIPSLYKLILDHVEPQQLVNLQSVTVAGESCPKELVERHRKLLPQISLFNEYGPTEGTVWSSVYDCHSHAPKNSIPIGRPIANTQIYLLDSHLQLVPIGVPGELHIGGLGLARGYQNRPELTAEKFIPNPFSNEPKARLYKTGDLARYLADGNLEFLGRIDYQVKIRGFRIELPEIEALLDQHPDLQEAVVVAQEGINGDKLVAYVVPNRKQAPTISELRRFLKDKLPEYMIPSTFVVLKALPLTPNGKIDRQALLTSNQIRPELEQAFVAPRTLIEQTLAEIWSQVFGLKQIGVHDNFFELGGDSILSIQILSRANERGLNFSLQQLSQHPTIDELAKFVKTVDARSVTIHQSLPFSLISKQDELRIPHDVEDAYPVTMLQAGMFFHSEYTPDSTIYYDIVSLHLRVPFDIQALQAGLKELVGRHPILRTSFDFTNFSEPLQLVHQNASIPLAVHDLRHLSDAGQEEILDALIEAEKSRKFDLKSAPLLRFQVHRRSEETFQLTYTCHDAILDGWSAASMLTELFQHYLNILGKKIRPIAPRPTATFRDYVALEKESVKSEDGRRYWTQKLNDSTVTMLPRWSSSCQVVDVEQHHLQTLPISLELSEDIKRLAQSTGVPLKSVLLAAHLRVLNLLSGQSDIQIGLVSNVRPEELDSERVLGLFLNTLPFRLQLPGGTWIDLIQATFQTECELLPFRWYPMAELQRIKGGQPLFETAFNFVHFHVAQGVLELEGIEYLGNKSYNPTNLTLLVSFGLHPTSSQIILNLEYDSTKLCEEQIQRICEYYVKTFTAMAGEPSGRYEMHSLLSEQERYQLLVEWNETKTNYPDDQCIHELFESFVEQTPDAVAVVFADEIVTYHELNTKANQLAHYLRSLGVKAEVLVGICVERSVEMVVGLLGILKAGGAYVPLDPTYPQERLSYMLADSGVEVLLTQQQLVEGLPKHSAVVVCLDSDWHQIAKHCQKNLITNNISDKLVYTIYTSGSTGKPKGAGVYHRGFLNLVNWLIKDFQFTSKDSTVLISSLSFDLTQKNVFAPLIVGGRLHLLADRFDPHSILDVVSKQRVTWINCTPSTFYSILISSNDSFAKIQSLRYVFLGGEPISISSLLSWLNSPYCGAKIVNSYGPTECADVCSAYIVQQPNEFLNKPIPIGKPIPNVKLYILDQNLQLVPTGVIGELCIAGAGVGMGYINDLERTNEKFISNPFSDTKSERLYKTGDLARHLTDGNIEYLARLDDQVKIRGFRIELGEIEAVLNTHPQIQQAVVIATEEVSGNKRLVAYVVPCDESLTTNQLREFLLSKLPEYMVPSAFVTLDTLPLTPNGKVDRKALPAPDGEINREHVKVTPRTPSEEIIANIFAAVLGVQNVGIHDNFFTNGGHSLLATQLISRLRLAFEVEIPIRAVFESPTVTQLDQTITQLRTLERGLTLPPIQPREADTELLPLSFAQERLWFLNQLEGSSGTYNIPAAVRITGNLDINAFQQALSEIIRRHSILRTSFQTVNGTPIQVIHPEVAMNIKMVDLQQSLAQERETGLQQLAHEDAITPFTLENAPLIRCSCVQLSTTEYVLLLTMHHIVSDGWSMGVFIRELSALYQASCAGVPSELPELPIQYGDFAVWQRQWLSGVVLESQLNYWLSQLHGAPELLQLPTDRPRPSVQTYQGTTQSFTVVGDLTQKLQSISRESGTSLFMTLLAAFSTLLYRYSGQSDIVIGSPIANRNRSEIESLIGFFVNTLVLRTRFEANPSFESLLSQVRETTLQAYEHQDVPFEQVVEALQPQRSLSHSPLFQVMFVWQNTPLGEIELPGVTLTQLDSQSTIAKFDLTLSMSESSQGLVGEWEYNTDLYDGSTIERMAAHFQNLLSAIVENPSQKVGELPLLSEAERHQLLVGWNNTACEYPTDKCIHQLFEEQVQKTPLSVAVVFENQQLTYLQLNQRANQLAHHLLSLGVGPEVLVGICVERSVEMVVGLLGILKAGGAYVPLDPAYPQERLAFMLEDAQVSLLLTTEKLATRLPEYGLQVVFLDTDWGVISRESATNLVRSATPEHLAYVVYTSGSTGKPKGVMIAHQSLVNFTKTATVEYGLSQSDRVLQFASINFDTAAEEIYPCLTCGGILVLRTSEMLNSVPEFLQKSSDLELTVLDLPTAYWHLVTSELATADLVLPDSLRLVIIGGEKALPQAVEIWQKRVRTISLVNTYGPTEATVVATLCKLSGSASVEIHNKIVPIGRPIHNVQVYVLDQNLQPVPIGVPGELYIGGAPLARGYLNRLDLTKEKFIPNPFSHEQGARLYKTGDLVRYLPDGNIEYLGRIDDQVKIRGFRIELGEIEAVLNTHPQIQQTIVIATEDIPGNKRACAYVVPSHQSLTTNQLREFLKSKLPEYMVPSAFVTLETLPLTPNGKIDYKALPIADGEITREHEYVAPRTAIELQLTQIWSSVINITPVGVRDNFFALGGHSLLAVRLISQIQQHFQINLPLATLFQSPTIEQLAHLLSSSTDSLPRSALVPIKSNGNQPPLFFIHPGGGNVLCYQDLAYYLSSEQPFYGLQSVGLNPQNQPHTSIEQMATHYIQELQTVQPEGPYLLGGWSMGGIVAFEIAQQLQAQGQKVALLALIDAHIMTDSVEFTDEDDVALLGSFAQNIGFSWENLEFSLDSFLQLEPEERLLYLLKEVQIANLLSPNVEISEFRRLFYVFKTNVRAMCSYKPRHLVGRVTLFKASEQFTEASLEPTLGWDKLVTEGVEIHIIPGNHYTIAKKPHVQVLAERLKTCLDQIQVVNSEE